MVYWSNADNTQKEAIAADILTQISKLGAHSGSADEKLFKLLSEVDKNISRVKRICSTPGHPELEESFVVFQNSLYRLFNEYKKEKKKRTIVFSTKHCIDLAIKFYFRLNSSLAPYFLV
jgi:hypothetical protein